jgi:uncharacterized protein (DUF433 family)
MHPVQPLDRAYLTPIYSRAQVSHLIETPASTVTSWTRPDGARALVTTAERSHRASVPFVGLTEAFVLAAFRRSGVPMQGIRPAVAALQESLGLRHALASDRLRTDGAEILLGASLDDPDDRLVVVRNGQAVFREVVDQYLRAIDFEHGYARSIELPRFATSGVRVSADPRRNGGRPSVRSNGVAVDDIVTRLHAGEAARDVAMDFDLTEVQIRGLARAA